MFYRSMLRLCRIVNRAAAPRKLHWAEDLDVPEVDGRTLYDLILEHKYTRALEIGTSTGHSGIWIARAVGTTGGKLTTIEIDHNLYIGFRCVRAASSPGRAPGVECPFLT